MSPSVLRIVPAHLPQSTNSSNGSAYNQGLFPIQQALFHGHQHMNRVIYGAVQAFCQCNAC